MEYGEIGRVQGAVPMGQRPGGEIPLPSKRSEITDRDQPPEKDRVERTEPHRAALRLLRERVLENTRLALELPRSVGERSRFARVPTTRPEVFFDRILADQNWLAAARRKDWSAERVEEALETGLVNGMSETTEILFELGELDADVWRLIGAVLIAFYRKLVGSLIEDD